MSKKIWSHGTPLGSLGSRSRVDLHLGFCQQQIFVVRGLHNCPELVAFVTQAENPKSVGAWCDPTEGKELEKIDGFYAITFFSSH